MRAVLYARRSTSDRDERQVQSIDDQVGLMRAKARQEGVVVHCELPESKSAKEPYQRPEFEAMLGLLDRGEADAILCWHLNRLFRNSVDMSAIQWRLQKGVIKRIITPDRSYFPEDNVLLFYMEAGVSNQTVLDLSKAVRRGLNSKIEKGWFPHRAPAGYLNEKWKEKGRKTIIKDPERFEMIRQAWCLVLSGGTTVNEVRKVLNERWNYRSPQRENVGGEPMGRSTLYAVFSNPFYAGYFLHDGRWYRGAHEPMVSWAEFTRVQTLIGRAIPFQVEGEGLAKSPHRQPQKHNLTYCGLLRCTLCGGLVTGHTVRKKSGKSYTYYFCQNTSGQCRKVAAPEKSLDELVDAELGRLFLLPEFDAWAKEELGHWTKSVQVAEGQGEQQGLEALAGIERQLESLLTLKIKDLISDEEFAARRTQLQNERAKLQGALDERGQQHDDARQAVENAVEFVANARRWFARGDADLRRAVVRALSSNLSFTRGKVLLEPHPLLEELRNEHAKLAVEFEAIKLPVNRYESPKNDPFRAVRPAWSRSLNDIRRLALNNSWFFPRIQANDEPEDVLPQVGGP